VDDMAARTSSTDTPRGNGHVRKKLAMASRRKRKTETRRSTTLQLQPPSPLRPPALYRYQSLYKQTNASRHLTLLPGEYSDDITVLLSNVPFDSDNPPRYEALSYAWGSDMNPGSCKVGQSGNRTISITQNLAAALPYLGKQTGLEFFGLMQYASISRIL